MPLQAIEIYDLNTPLIKEPKVENELSKRIGSMYAEDNRFHGWTSAEEAIEAIQVHIFDKQEKALKNGLIVGMFNDKPVCAVMCQNYQEGDKTVKSLEHLVMHIQNLNRGIEEQLINLISLNNRAESTHLTSKNAEILKIIKKVLDS